MLNKKILIIIAELQSPAVKELLHSKDDDFDLVLIDFSGSSSIFSIFSHKFNAPLVAITNGEAFPNVHEGDDIKILLRSRNELLLYSLPHKAFGNPIHPVSFPSVLLPFSENLDLIERVSSVLFTIWYR